MNIDPVRYSGRPAERRSEPEEAIYDKLAELHIPFDRVDHDHADTMEDCRQIEAVLGGRICKNLFLCNRQQTDFYLLAMPGQKPFKTKLLSKQIGSARLSFADGGHMLEYLDLEPGSVSVLGLMNDKNKRVRLLMDRELLQDEFFGCHPCRNTSSLRFRMADLMEKILPAMEHEVTFVDLPWQIED